VEALRRRSSVKRRWQGRRRAAAVSSAMVWWAWEAGRPVPVPSPDDLANCLGRGLSNAAMNEPWELSKIANLKNLYTSCFC
jgi:hypothetical protein